jgi:aminoglycoside/choline kinase family phosphotransferase
MMIDFQGAFLAPPEYDLVCLLHDSHVPLAESIVRELAEATRPKLPDQPDRQDFDERFSLLTLIRVAKDCAHYLHAARQQGDTRYMKFVPTALSRITWAADEAAQRDSAFANLREIVAAISPPEELESCAE